MCRAWLAPLALLSFAAACPAQSWVDTIFPEQAHDFGVVARGSTVKHSFRLVNTTNSDLHIAGWRTKCGCTDVRVGARDIPPGTQTFIEATLDTTRFQGQKTSGLTLVFDRPGYVEKDLNLSCFIRGDVLLSPGAVDFGQVQRAKVPTVTLILNYVGGQTNWGITKVDTLTPHVTARLEEIDGTRTPGSVQYRLIAQLKPTVPTGYFKDEITLHTNDPSTPTIPVSVSASVQAQVSVSPSPLVLGQVRAGQVVTRDVLVRSGQPFTITQAVAKQGDVSATTGGDSPRPIHKLTVTIKAPSKPGPYYGLVELQTSVPDEPPVKVAAFATVVP
jgi:hypothetical protein